MSVPLPFLVGAERSGTTMLRLMLDHHPQISWVNEFEYAVDPITEDGRYPDVPGYIKELSQNRIFRSTGFYADPSLGYRDLITSFLEDRRVRSGKPIVGATVHRHFHRVLTLYPDALFIHVIRDPRDVAPSVKRIGWAGNMFSACTKWIQAEECWDIVRSRIPEDRYVEIRYEELLADPEKDLTRVCALMGLGFDPAMLEYDQSTSYEKVDPSAAQRWKHTLCERDISLIESRCGDLVLNRGYEPVSKNLKHPGACARAYYQAQNRWYKARFRMRKFGIKLWVRAAIAKRFSPNGSYPGLKAAMDEITRSRLQ